MKRIEIPLKEEDYEFLRVCSAKNLTTMTNLIRISIEWLKRVDKAGKIQEMLK